MRFIAAFFGVILLLGATAVGGLLYVFHEYGRDLPDYHQLADYRPPVVTRVHAGDGRLLAEYATEKRVFVPITAIPLRVVNAFLSAEDKNFYDHPGIDPLSIVRAAVTNIANLGSNRRPVGASTITQQVAKNFLLTSEVSIERKIKEAILALRIEQAFTKDEILELYLNEIYLGFQSYGVAAAALNYFNKSLDDLTIAEAAFLAALPKAPNNYHPVYRRVAAIARRDWVIGRMVEDGRIRPEDAQLALAAPLEIRQPDETQVVEAQYFAEETRRELIDLFGEDSLYRGGLSVRTTLDPRLQDIAERSLRAGLIAYDRRHGWRGPVAELDLSDEAGWVAGLAAIPPPPDAWQQAVVLDVSEKAAQIGLPDGARGQIPFAEAEWARPWQEGQEVGPPPKRMTDVLATGQVVLVEALNEIPAEGTEEAEAQAEAGPEDTAQSPGLFALRQMPEVDGGIVAMDPHTGRVLAMVGGFSYQRSEFNRVTQAARQPGSAFKPFVYLAALDSGFTPATLILDAPFVIDQGAGRGKWKPANYTRKFYGPTPMRVGIEKSRNLMTVRLAQTIGMEKVADYAERFNIVDRMPAQLAMSLGADETTLVQLTTAYAMLVNGGRRITPTVIDRIQNRTGATVFRHDRRDCPGCRVETWARQREPELPDEREQVADPASAFQIVGMLQGVVQRGTGQRVRSVGKPLAGKTGTTNDNLDAWFIGFSPDLAVGVYVGFDEPQTLGPKDTGSNVAAPIFRDFMAEALADRPAIPFRIPPGVRLVRVNADTGQLAKPGDSRVILEAFKPGTVPDGRRQLIDGGYNPEAAADGANGRSGVSGTGGIY